MELLRAEGGAFIPILIIWGVMMVLGQIQKAKKRAEQQQLQGGGEPEPSRQRGLLDELQRAMLELKQVERQQAGADDSEPSETRAEAYLAARQRHVAPTQRRPSTTRRRDQVFVPQVHVPTFDEEGSLEGGDVREGADVRDGVEERTDYDFESARIASERRAQTAANWHDGQGPVDTLHTALDSPAQDPRAASRSPLARYADGTARSAVVLGIILGPPKSDA